MLGTMRERKRFSACLVVAGILTASLMAGCSSPTSAPAATPSATALSASMQPIIVTIESEVSNSVDNAKGWQPMFHITTNLPWGAEIMFTLRGPGGYTGQTKRFLSENGSATTGPFSLEWNSLRAGNYTLTVSMSVAVLQPVGVQKVIGAKGEMLRGPLVHLSDLGQGNYVSADFSYTF